MSWLKKRYRTKELRTSTKETWNRDLILKDMSKGSGLFLFIAVFLFLAFGPRENTISAGNVEKKLVDSDEVKNRPSGPQIIAFNANVVGITKRSNTIRSKGSLIKARILNQVEAFESVPLFARIVDYGLGNSYFGKTIIGDATGDPNISKIKVNFHTIRVNDYNAKAISAQALALDGTLGLKAQKKEGILSRSILGTARAGTQNPVDADKLGGDLQGLILGTLLRVLRVEMRQDIESEYNNKSVLALKPGVEFFIQLTDDLEAK